MMQTIKTIFNQKKELTLSLFAVFATIVFMSLGNFSVFVIILGLINILFIYLYQFNKNSEYISYGLVFVLSYVCVYILKNYQPNNILFLILLCGSITAVFYFIFTDNIKDLPNKNLYTILFFLISSQVAYMLVFLRYSIAAESLYITLFFYLVSGLIKLYNENKFTIYPVLKYSCVFLVCFTILSFNTNYLI